MLSSLFRFCERRMGLSLVALSFFCLLFAFFVEYGLGYKPCQFCWYERYVYLAVCVFGLLTLLVGRRNHRVFWGFVAILGVGVGVNLVHVGIERGLITESLCSVGEINYSEVLASLDNLDDGDERMPSCAKVPFYIFGLSMAEYNLALFVFIFLLSFFWCYKRRKW